MRNQKEIAPRPLAPPLFNLIPAIETAPKVNLVSPSRYPVPFSRESAHAGIVPRYLRIQPDDVIGCPRYTKKYPARAYEEHPFDMVNGVATVPRSLRYSRFRAAGTQDQANGRDRFSCNPSGDFFLKKHPGAMGVRDIF
jgi:hypothetical protein